MIKRNKTKIILASGSPRRIEYLKSLGLEFEVIPAGIHEDSNGKGSPAGIARKLAKEKALAVAGSLKDPKALIISGDTIVVTGNNILGKPASKKEAVEMLHSLSGKTHKVITALCLIQGPKIQLSHVTTYVTFNDLSPAAIRSYVESGEPMDKAGAYAIQGKGVLLVKKINGDYPNVVGLPIVRLAEMLSEFGIKLRP